LGFGMRRCGRNEPLWRIAINPCGT
jgi:hypothetical protein